MKTVTLAIGWLTAPQFADLLARINELHAGSPEEFMSDRELNLLDEAKELLDAEAQTADDATYIDMTQEV